MAECTKGPVSNLNSSNQSVVNEGNDSKEDTKSDRAMEPLLVEDLKPHCVPKSFETLQKSLFDKKVHLDREDYVVLLIHILMLEVGFIPRQCSEYYHEESYQFHYRRILDIVTHLPSNWKAGSSCYLLQYLLPPFITYDCQLAFTVYGDDMILNCVIPKIPNTNYSVLLDPALYVMTSTTKIENKFQNMNHLSRTVKNNICNPAKHSILVQNGLRGLCLEDVPLEVIYTIIKYLNTVDLAMMERTCKFFRLIANDRLLWKQIRGLRTEKTFSHYKRAELIQHGRNDLHQAIRFTHLL